jgi:hypothetical protein
MDICKSSVRVSKTSVHIWYMYVKIAPVISCVMCKQDNTCHTQDAHNTEL